MAVFGAFAASAKEIPFAPKTGKYSGTILPSAGSPLPTPVTAQVSKDGKRYLVQMLISTTLQCANGSSIAGGISIPAPLTGKTFSAAKSAKDSRSGGTATYEVSGHFSSETAFTGTASKEISAGPLLPEQGACSTDSLAFALKKK